MLTHLNISGLVYVTDNPELRFTTNKTAVVQFNVAANSSYQDHEGCKVEESCFIRCSAWSKLAEAINKYVGKGDPLYIEGQLKQENWTDKEDKKQSRHTVKIDKITFLKSKE